MPEDYPQSLKREGVSLEDSENSKDYREKINCWKSLVENGLNGKYQIIRYFPEARVTLFGIRSQN